MFTPIQIDLIKKYHFLLCWDKNIHFWGIFAKFQPQKCDKFQSNTFPIAFSVTPHTLGEEILAGRKFGGNKIWRNWREFNLADAKKC